MAALRVLPDAERLVIDFLVAHTDLDALLANRIYTEIPTTPTFPLVRLNRIGGIPRWPQHLDVARIQVEAWGDRGQKSIARNTAATVRAALADLPGQRALGTVTNVSDDLGLTWSPDPDTGRARYLFAIAVTLHPLPS